MGETATATAPRVRLPSQPGLLLQLFREPVPVLDRVRAEVGPVATFGAGPVRMAVVGSAAAAEQLFSLPTDSFRWNHKFNALAVVVGPGSMIVSDGEDHRRRRAAVQEAFARRRLNGWIPMIVEQADAAIDAVSETPSPLNLYEVGRALLLEIVVRAFFGPDLAARAQEIGDHFYPQQDYLELPAYKQVPHPFPFGRRGEVKAHRAAIHAIIDEAIARRRKARDGDRSDLLSALVSDGTLDDAEIRDQVVTLIGAGYDTSAASLAWTLTRALGTDGVWSRMRAEADEVFARPLVPETPAALRWTGDVLRESMRLHPAGVLSPREAAEDVVVDGVRIPKGTLILWSAHLIGRDGRVFEEPETFDPDRWARADDAQAAAQKAAWVPFGGGRRNCIGFAMAQLQLTLILARFAQRLDAGLVRSTVPAPVGMVVNRPSGGVPAMVARRPGV